MTQAPPLPSQTTDRRTHKHTALKQAIALQALLFKAANDDETTPAALAQVARAWSDLEDRKRVIRMKPAPKPIDTTKLPSRKPAKSDSAPAFAESESK